MIHMAVNTVALLCFLFHVQPLYVQLLNGLQVGELATIIGTLVILTVLVCLLSAIVSSLCFGTRKQYVYMHQNYFTSLYVNQFLADLKKKYKSILFQLLQIPKLQ